MKCHLLPPTSREGEDFLETAKARTSKGLKQEEFGAFPPPGLQQSPEQNGASTSAVPDPLPAVVSQFLWHSSQSAPRVPPLRKEFTFPQSRAEASSLQCFRRTEDSHCWAS